MTANNMSQLEAMLMKELKKSMHIASEKMLADMYDNTSKFYTKGNPKEYERTGALGDTPKITALTVNGNSVSFDAYLDNTHQYTTGKNPNMEDVLKLANSGITNSSVGKLRPALGRTGFWEASENEMDKILNRTLSKFFKIT